MRTELIETQPQTRPAAHDGGIVIFIADKAACFHPSGDLAKRIRAMAEPPKRSDQAVDELQGRFWPDDEPASVVPE